MFGSLKKTFFLLIFSIFIFQPLIFGQTQDINQNDLSTLEVDKLTDDQISAFIKKAEQSGMTMEQLESAALAKGMQPSEVEKLKNRIEKLQSGSTTKTDSEKFKDRSRSYKQESEEKLSKRDKLLKGKTQEETDEETELTEENQEDDIFGTLNTTTKKKKKERPEDKIFGFSMFNNKKFTFEPSLNIPTPQNYQLGPDDEIVIDIWGASQQTYKLKISPEGTILISNIGPILISGMTIEEATGKIKKDLSNIYAGLRGSSANTFIKVSLASVKSIKVNILGDVYKPGTYTISSLSTAFNGLYAAGGPALNGSLRNVKVVREGKNIAELDFYDYLLKGEQKNNIRLQDQDVVFISPYANRVEIKGEIKRPAFYDLKNSESLKTLIAFAGGPTGKAYTQRFRVFRKTGRENKVFDIPVNLADTLKLSNGDEVVVDSVINRFENRIEIKGAIYRPGVFSLDSGLTLKQLIVKADGLRGDAFKNRISIYRTSDDLSMEVIPVDLLELMKNSSKDVVLQREDLVVVPSIFDLKEEYTVQITGEIGKPGIYSFVANSSVEDLIVRAGGLRESASLAKIEIARRVKNNLANTSSDQVAEIFQFPISKDLKISDLASKFILQPFDQVFVRLSPGYEIQKLIKIEGEVAFPGSYVITSKREKISDMIARAGGLTNEAYIKGARLVRKLPIDKKQRLEALQAISSYSHDSHDSIRIVKLAYVDETTIGVDLEKILYQPGSSYDFLLQKDDSIYIPKELQTVR